MSIYCCYKDCSNVQRSFSSKTFFNLPNDSRREAWIKNSGNIEMYGISITQRRLFCEDHFDPKYLRCQFNRTTLRRDAVPYAHDDIQDSHEIEFIELEEDDSQERTEETQTDAPEANNDFNNITIVLKNSQTAQIPTDSCKRVEMVKRSKVTEASAIASKRMLLKQSDSNRSEKHPSTDDNNDIELEVDLIVVDDEKETGQSTESNENGQTPATNRKRLRLEVEPLISQPNESSPNVEKDQPISPKVKSPSIPQRTSPPQSRKSVEEIVSSSEVFDANSEDKYFALSILGTLRRLTPHKRALAKCHILSYLTEIEYGNSNATT